MIEIEANINDLVHLVVFQWVEDNNIDAVRNWAIYDNGDLNIRNANGDTLLGIAILKKYWRLAELLMDQRADVNVEVVTQQHGRVSLMRILMENDRWDLVRKMILSGADPRMYFNHISPLVYFSKNNDINMVSYILSSGIRDIENYPEHNSPLKSAAIAGHLNIVRKLVDFSIMVGMHVNRDGSVVVRTGVNKGASINRRETLDGTGAGGAQCEFTPVQYAAMFGHRDIVLYLMSLPQHQSDFANINMGFSLDFFGERNNYSAYIDMDQVVESMLPLPRPTTPAVDLEERRNLRADILLLQAGTKYYTLQRVVPRIEGTPVEIQQRRDVYLTRAILALDILERSVVDPPIINPNARNGVNRIVVLQKMAFAWFCSSIATYTRNHSNLSNVSGWKAIRDLGALIDSAGDRGYLHGNRLIVINGGIIFDNAFKDILTSIPQVRQFLSNPTDILALKNLQATPLCQVSAYLNDYNQVSKLKNMYLDFSGEDLQSGDRDRIEAALNAVAASLEVITSHLSDVSLSYFHDLNFEALSQIRNHLRHVNGNNHEHNVFFRQSRAQRFEALVSSRNPTLMNVLIHFMQHDFDEIRNRINKYQAFLDSIDSLEMLYQKFIISEGKMAYVKNTAWSYFNFPTYRRKAENLRMLLEQPNNSAHLLEEPAHYHLRTETAIPPGRNDAEFRLWNARVRVFLGLTNTHLNSLQRQDREMVKKIMKTFLPNQTDGHTLIFSKKIHCYLKHSANMHYVILNLQRIIHAVNARQERLQAVIQERFRAQDDDENDELNVRLNKDSVMYYNALEWLTVHFYEHAIEFTKIPIFLDTYREHNGNTVQLIRDLEQIRNYIAHVANLSFASENGQAVGPDQLSNLHRHAAEILQGFQRVQAEWKGLLQSLIDIVPAEKLATFMLPAVQMEESYRRYCGLTGKQLATVGIFGAVAIGTGYYYFGRGVSQVPPHGNTP